MYSLPLVNAKLGDNGIMFYGKPEDFSAESMTIDVIKNGEIATGKVYAQPQPTGVLWDAYLIKLKNEPTNMSPHILLYLATVIEKSIRQKYSYDNKAIWKHVSKEHIYLPITADKTPDWDYMEKYIRALEKTVIADVVKYKDQVIQATKEVVAKES